MYSKGKKPISSKRKETIDVNERVHTMIFLYEDQGSDEFWKKIVKNIVRETINKNNYKIWNEIGFKYWQFRRLSG